MLRFQLEAICNKLDIGTITTHPTPVSGGLLHEIWHVATNKGQYAVKVLNSKIMQRPGAVARYETTETIAKMFFEQGIPVITSITHNNKSVIEVEGTYFIVYPWVSGSVLDAHTTNKECAQKIAAILARMHQLNIQLPELTQYTWDIHPNSYFKDLIIKASENNLPFSKTLSDMSSSILAWNDKYRQAIPQLNKHTIISHGDMDQKNVLWAHDHQPMIIDWEAARLVNPTQEIISVSLDWSGFSSGHIDTEIFSSIIDAYKKAGGKINNDDSLASFDCIVGNWLNWMVYNIERSLDNSDKENQLGIAQVEKTLDSLVYLTSRVQELIKLL